MTVSNYYGQKSKYRITLELDVLDDFNPRQIEWEKLFELQDNETVESVIEDLQDPVSW
mgnify:FL=1|tara:strand:+ start:383 stop:556 length:174 start_codon:yes stop_codon:yes gene_type:complete